MNEGPYRIPDPIVVALPRLSLLLYVFDPRKLNFSFWDDGTFFGPKGALNLEELASGCIWIVF